MTNFGAIKAIVKNVDDIYELLTAYTLILGVNPGLADFANFTESVRSKLESIRQTRCYSLSVLDARIGKAVFNLESAKFRAIKCMARKSMARPAVTSIVKNVDGIYDLLTAYTLIFEVNPGLADFDKFTQAVSSKLESISDKVFSLLGGQPSESHEENKEVLDVDDNSKTK